jgi:hypothetical protein
MGSENQRTFPSPRNPCYKVGSFGLPKKNLAGNPFPLKYPFQVENCFLLIAGGIDGIDLKKRPKNLYCFLLKGGGTVSGTACFKTFSIGKEIL